MHFLAVFPPPLFAIFQPFAEGPAILKFYNSPNTTLLHNPPMMGEGSGEQRQAAKAGQWEAVLEFY